MLALHIVPGVLGKRWLLSNLNAMEDLADLLTIIVENISYYSFMSRLAQWTCRRAGIRTIFAFTPPLKPSLHCL